jgi:methionyl-tRNA formyltransferase
LFVKTGKGELQLLQVQPATKKIMNAKDFVNGYQLKTGDSFSTV